MPDARSKRGPDVVIVSSLVLTLAVLLPACGSTTPGPSAAQASSRQLSASAAPAASAGKWEDVGAGAKKEGQVVVYGPPGANYRQALFEPFESANRGIKVNFTGATGSDIGMSGVMTGDGLVLHSPVYQAHD